MNFEKMTRRSTFYQTKIKTQAKLQSLFARHLFSNKKTLFGGLIKKLLGLNITVVNDDPELKHPDV